MLQRERDLSIEEVIDSPRRDEAYGLLKLPPDAATDAYSGRRNQQDNGRRINRGADALHTTRRNASASLDPTRRLQAIGNAHTPKVQRTTLRVKSRTNLTTKDPSAGIVQADERCSRVRQRKREGS
jgi:hypothetical protein